jgi:hypothetical protein
MRREVKSYARSYGSVGMLALAVIAALLGASRLSRVLFERPRDRAAAAGREGALAASLPVVPADGQREENLYQVTLADGHVEAFRDERWITIQRGDLLTPDDVVRTVAGARAVLKLGASTEIELREKVEVRLDRLSGSEASVDLRHGKVVARVVRAGDNLVITARETRASNTGPAHFIVVAEETGKVAVAATQGSVRFAAGGKEITVPQGTESRAQPDAGPADPEKIPEDVLLSVVWPDAERHAAHVPVKGQVGPSSVVTVNGAKVDVSADGKFTTSVALRPGSNAVNVETEDITGRKKNSSATLVRQPPRPKLEAETTELWAR